MDNATDNKKTFTSQEFGSVITDRVAELISKGVLTKTPDRKDISLTPKAMSEYKAIQVIEYIKGMRDKLYTLTDKTASEFANL